MPYKNSIAITIDNNYVQHACVMLMSLSANVKEIVNVYCIYSDLNVTNRKRIETELRNTRVTITFVEFNTSVLPTLPIKPNDHVSAATFLRIWLPELFPNLDQLLFMDTDLVVNGDISELLDLTVIDQPLAAVPDTGMTALKKETLGLQANTPYFNAGMMLINLAYFRKHHLTEEISLFIEQHPELCEFWDQDALNAVIKGNFELLDYKYNVQSGFYEINNNDALALKAIENPIVIHYSGGGNGKPWFYNNRHPQQDVYYKYLKLTSFRYYYPPDLPRKWRMFRKIKFRLLYK